MKKIAKPSKKVLGLGGILLILLLPAAVYFLNLKEAVTVDEVRLAPVEEVIKERGILRSRSRMDLFSPAGGEIQSLMVEIGDEVARGDILVTMDDTQARLRLDSLVYEVRALETTLEISDAKGDEEAVRMAREDYLKAGQDYENARILYESGALSKGEYDAAGLLFSVAGMQLDMARDQSSARHLTLKSLESQVEILMDELSDYQVRAPFDGIVSEIHVSDGQRILGGTPLLQLYEESFFIEVDLLEEELVQLSMATPVRIRRGEERLETMIEKIHPTIKPVVSDLGVTQLKGLVEVEAVGGFDTPGREVDVVFVLKASEEALTVDKQALVKYNGGDYVYRLLAGRAALTPVTLGIEGGDRYEILGGLEAGDRVILNPSEGIDEGTRVAIKD